MPGTGGLLTMGPLKVVTDGSLNTRTACCDDPYPGLTGAHARGVLLVAPDELLPLLRRAAAHGLDAAVHAIGDRANALVLDAFAAPDGRRAEPATGRRIEHAQLLRDVDPARFAALGVVASVQPAHVLDDRDVADRLWAGRTGRAFPYRTLLDAGVELVLGSDAPVAPLDPWITIAAAVHRSGDDRPSWHPEQEIPLPVALAASTGPDGPVAVGRRADLVRHRPRPGRGARRDAARHAGGGHAARRPLDPPRRHLTRPEPGPTSVAHNRRHAPCSPFEALAASRALDVLRAARRRRVVAALSWSASGVPRFSAGSRPRSVAPVIRRNVRRGSRARSSTATSSALDPEHPRRRRAVAARGAGRRCRLQALTATARASASATPAW